MSISHSSSHSDASPIHEASAYTSEDFENSPSNESSKNDSEPMIADIIKHAEYSSNQSNERQDEKDIDDKIENELSNVENIRELTEDSFINEELPYSDEEDVLLSTGDILESSDGPFSDITDTYDSEVDLSSDVETCVERLEISIFKNLNKFSTFMDGELTGVFLRLIIGYNYVSMDQMNTTMDDNDSFKYTGFSFTSQIKNLKLQNHPNTSDKVIILLEKALSLLDDSNTHLTRLIRLKLKSFSLLNLVRGHLTWSKRHFHELINSSRFKTLSDLSMTNRTHTCLNLLNIILKIEEEISEIINTKYLNVLNFEENWSRLNLDENLELLNIFSILHLFCVNVFIVKIVINSILSNSMKIGGNRQEVKTNFIKLYRNIQRTRNSGYSQYHEFGKYAKLSKMSKFSESTVNLINRGSAVVNLSSLADDDVVEYFFKQLMSIVSFNISVQYDYVRDVHSRDLWLSRHEKLVQLIYTLCNKSSL